MFPCTWWQRRSDAQIVITEVCVFAQLGIAWHSLAVFVSDSGWYHRGAPSVPHKKYYPDQTDGVQFCSAS